jgi:hypothetical protein
MRRRLEYNYPTTEYLGYVLHRGVIRDRKSDYVGKGSNHWYREIGTVINLIRPRESTTTTIYSIQSVRRPLFCAFPA